MTRDIPAGRMPLASARTAPGDTGRVGQTGSLPVRVAPRYGLSGRAVRARREALGLTREDLVDETVARGRRVSVETIRRIEVEGIDGTETQHSVAQVLADALGVEVAALSTG